ncbi:hypothetical protein BJ322DRAFT_1023621 [Thelephora terrestris]|uniref:Uncharacterized protein n=1 Tax=Thelephora terrestris TaxID=56493 RepID=A0A9P6H7L0_9AGAM|nr:hypothetical protein BJ322DRAFT_1023621 [Thelephora terrestris]
MAGGLDAVPLDQSNEPLWIPRMESADGKTTSNKHPDEWREGLRQLTDGKPEVIVKRDGWLAGVLCKTTEFVSTELAELDQDGKRGTGVGERVERVADEGTVAGRSNCNLCGPREGTLQYDLTGKCDKRWNEQKRKDNHRRRDDRTRTRPSGPVRCAASGHRVRGKKFTSGGLDAGERFWTVLDQSDERHLDTTGTTPAHRWEAHSKGADGLPGVLCETTEFVSVELAESGQVSAGGWLERLGTCKPTKRGPTTFVGEQGDKDGKREENR